MKKEVLIAIIIGFLIGLVITFGVYTAQRSLSSDKPKNASVNQIEAPITSGSVAQNPQNLTLSSPENGAIADRNPVTITGSTAPGSMIAIIGAKDHTTAFADQQGNFSGEITLQEGANTLKIEAYHVSGGTTTENLTVIYLPSDQTPTPASSITPKQLN